MPLVRTIDIGGSSVKTMTFSVDLDVQPNDELLILDQGADNHPHDFAEWFVKSITGKRNTNADILSVCAPERYLNEFSQEIADGLGVPHCNDDIVDSVAHAFNFVDSNFPRPIIILTLGTAVGSALIEYNEPVDIDEYVGKFRLKKTEANPPEAWKALGHHGLNALEKKYSRSEAHKHYGQRLGWFIVNFLVLKFNPATIVLSGGIADSCYSGFGPYLNEIIQQEPFHKPPHIELSSYGRETGLWGLAKMTR
ncbi:MAG: hypothetical protein P9L92_00590 [Candidatus Electryonea clarkiae]|nr:hypothetical protein [Candidatus Electryonea clarkiae]MDP8287076.1 hypothetical protein [Candidatus Electryonea clarkiae]